MTSVASAVATLLANMAPGSTRSTSDLAQCLGWPVIKTDAACAMAAALGHISFTPEGWHRPDTPEEKARRARQCGACGTEHVGDCPPEEETMAKKKAPAPKKKAAKKPQRFAASKATVVSDVKLNFTDGPPDDPIGELIDEIEAAEKTEMGDAIGAVAQALVGAIDQATGRVAIPTVDEDGVERPSVQVFKAPAQDVPTGTRYLKHMLSSDEIEEKRSKREAGDAEIDAIQEEIDKATKQLKHMKARHELLVEDGLKASRIIRDGFEYQNVPISERRCEDGRDDTARQGKPGEIGVGSFRDDTGELIEWRPLTAAERQGKLFDEPSPEDSVGFGVVDGDDEPEE